MKEFANTAETHRRVVLARVKRMNRIGRLLFGYEELKAYDQKIKKSQK